MKVETESLVVDLGIQRHVLRCGSECVAGKDCKGWRSWKRSVSAVVGISGGSDCLQWFQKSGNVMNENNPGVDSRSVFSYRDSRKCEMVVKMQ